MGYPPLGLNIDVFGLRALEIEEEDTDSFRSIQQLRRGALHVEGIAIEVKASTRRPSQKDIAQASQYGRLAHRCYLAQPSEFNYLARRDAERFGVGLITIEGSGPRYNIKQISESTRFTPEARDFDGFLKRIRIGRCSFCKRYWFLNPASPQDRNFLGRYEVVVGDQGKPGKDRVCPRCQQVIRQIVAVGKK